MLLTLLASACLSPTELTVGRPDSAPVATADSSDTATGTTLDSGDSGPGTEDTESGPGDADGDGYDADVDCDDNDPDIHPLQFDECNGVDDDCDGVIDATDCPCPINHFEDHAYLFCEESDDWQVARDLCAEVGYTLVSIGSDGENEWLWNAAEALDDREWWTGLNDRDQEGDFTWVSGETVTYTNWGDGEPNDWGSGEDCMTLHTARNHEWNDLGCDYVTHFICEAG